MAETLSASAAHIVVGVADLAVVQALWIERFGLEVVARLDGPDAGLARVWQLEPDAIRAQLLVRTPGAGHGMLHFVCFNDPGRPVRENAAPTDLGPKNLDICCTEIAKRCEELAADGYTFRSEISEYEIAGLRAKEVQMPGHDDTNIVFIEIFGWPIKLSAKHYGAVTSFVVIVPDTLAEAAFYSSMFGLDELMHHRITGQAIEEVVGLPAGSALDMRVMGNKDELYGRIELITYEGIRGIDRFPLARPPALGSLSCCFKTRDLDAVLERARKENRSCVDHGYVDLVYGSGRLATLVSPAGFSVEVMQTL